MTIALWMWLAAVALAASPGDTHRTSWYATPGAGYSTDDGIGAGARAEVARHAPGFEPYKALYAVSVYMAASGFQSHRFRMDLNGLGPWRVTSHLAWRQWLNDGYWGIGNGTTREAAYVGNFDKSDPARKRYRYGLFQPFMHVTARRTLTDGGPSSVFVALNPKYSTIRSYAGSLLEEQQPYGMDGGFVVQAFGGWLYDTRAPEIAPRQGVLVELSGRAAPQIDAEAGGFGGGFASVRAFTSRGPFVLATRVMCDYLFGAVPFYEMVHWGGSVPISGFGGYATIRGVSLGRWRAPGKAVGNLEVRWAALRHQFARRPLVWEVAAYTDAGVVFDGQDEATAPAPDMPVHPAVGGGLRLVFDETFVGRVDAGVGFDPVEREDGSVADERTFGLYFVFDHAY